jgi:hypothetical protein
MNVSVTGRYRTPAKICALLMAFAAAGMTVTGCASGGYKLTRAYARFINSKPLLLRIVLYIFIGIFFVVTELLDALIFNTVDFWSGKVSANQHRFEKDGNVIEVAHSRSPLRQSVFDISERSGKKTRVELREVADQKVDVYVNGTRKARLDSIDEAMSSLTMFGRDGVSPISRHAFDAQDFAELEILPVRAGVETVMGRFGMGPAPAVALRK